MPHQNPTKATHREQAVTEPREPTDVNEVGLNLDPEPRTYAARDVRDSTVAAPAAGEIGDFFDEGEAIDGSEFPGGQQGGTNRNREAHSDHLTQGAKTVKANHDMARRGSSDQGTH